MFRNLIGVYVLDVSQSETKKENLKLGKIWSHITSLINHASKTINNNGRKNTFWSSAMRTTKNLYLTQKLNPVHK